MKGPIRLSRLAHVIHSKAELQDVVLPAPIDGARSARSIGPKMRISEADILRGIDRGEFFPVFQPIVALGVGELVGFEVLARWKLGHDQFVPPDTFIPAVEKLGLINRLSNTILAQAFACAPISNSNLALSFNLSTTQLLDPRLPAKLESIANEHRFPLNRLTIEITETALVDDLHRASLVAGALKSLGCRLALDDFGTGYSSMKHLHSLPFDELKIDRSFVQSMTEKRESRKIVASVIGLGHSLELSTVAEGIEKPEQAEMLFWMGCNLGQGWFYGPAVASTEVPEFMVEPGSRRSRAIFSAQSANQALSLETVPAHRLAQLQAIYDGAPVGLCFLDRQMRYVSLNQQLAKMNNVPAAEHVGRKVCEVIPDLFPMIEPHIMRALAGEPVSHVELSRPATVSSGPAKTVIASYQPVRDEMGDVVGVSVALTDATQRKGIEEALRTTEDHYRHLMNLNPHILYVLNARGEVVDASPRWTELTGQSIADALGNGWLGCLHPDDVAPTVSVIQRSIASRCSIDVTYRIGHNGRWKWMRSRGALRFDHCGDVEMIYGSVEEIEPALSAVAL
jgi:PAS domain S-box-containing protein